MTTVQNKKVNDSTHLKYVKQFTHKNVNKF